MVMSRSDGPSFSRAAAKVALVVVGLGILVMAVGSSMASFDGVGSAYDEGGAEGTAELLAAVTQVSIGLVGLALIVAGFGLGGPLGWNGLRVAGGLFGVVLLLIAGAGFSMFFGLEEAWLASMFLTLFGLPGLLFIAAGVLASPSTGSQTSGALALAGAGLFLTVSTFGGIGTFTDSIPGGPFEQVDPSVSTGSLLFQLPMLPWAAAVAAVGLVLVLGPPRTHRAGIATVSGAGLLAALSIIAFSVAGVGGEVWTATDVTEDPLTDAAIVTSVVGLFITGAGALVGSMSAVAYLGRFHQETDLAPAGPSPPTSEADTSEAVFAPPRTR